MEKFTEGQLQVALTGIFGDGCLSGNKEMTYTTNCKFKEYVEYKKKIIEPMFADIKRIEKNGYSQTPIYCLRTRVSPLFSEVKEDSVENNLNKLTDLGRALWFYDDGSLHKKNLFYNLNTHAFSEEIHHDLFVPYFRDCGFGEVKVYKDRKKDGREFSYLYFGRTKGAFKINELLRKYPISCYKYKIWPEEQHLKRSHEEGK